MNMVSGSVEYVKNAGAETEVDFVYSLVLIEASPKNADNSVITTIYCEDAKINLSNKVVLEIGMKTLPSFLELLEQTAKSISTSQQ